MNEPRWRQFVRKEVERRKKPMRGTKNKERKISLGKKADVNLGSRCVPLTQLLAYRFFSDFESVNGRVKSKRKCRISDDLKGKSTRACHNSASWMYDIRIVTTTTRTVTLSDNGNNALGWSILFSFTPASDSIASTAFEFRGDQNCPIGRQPEGEVDVRVSLKFSMTR